jgi:peptidoglycan/xylan/chitin deacetylase (PgdA/CDA1 family)
MILPVDIRRRCPGGILRVSIGLGVLLLIGCTSLGGMQRSDVLPMPGASAGALEEGYAHMKARLSDEFGNRVPCQWGQAVDGILTRLDTDHHVMALTFDACGGPLSSGYDAELIRFLEEEQVAATLFVNARWILVNPDAFRALAAEPLFEIANHGLLHRPCSVTGQWAYGIQGPSTVADLVDEIEISGRMITALTGRRPVFYRPGTAYCDEIGVQVARSLGYVVAGFSVLGDAGATYTREQVRDALLAAPPGAIVILHMNHPEGQTRHGVMEAVVQLKQRGVRFVTLTEGVDLTK